MRPVPEGLTDGELRLPMLRQQTTKPDGCPNRCLADYVAADGDHLGGFAVAIHGDGGQGIQSVC